MQAPVHASDRVIRFAPFTLDVRTAELRKHGIKVRLPQQSFQILLMLLDSPGEVVLREQIRTGLWPAGTVVEFDHSINAALKNLRGALGDSASDPRYIETVGRQGYRFIATLDLESPPANPYVTQRRINTPITAGVVALSVAAGLWLYRTGGQEQNYEPVPLTAYQGAEWQPTFSPDGNQVAFAWRQNRDEQAQIYAKVVGAGDPLRLTSDAGEHLLPAWSPDGKWIAFVGRHSERRVGIYVIPALGGPERHLTDDPSVDSLSWSPDGKWLVVAPHPAMQEPSIVFYSTATGERKELGQQYMELKRASAPRFSPDGKRLVYVQGKLLETQIFVAKITSDLRIESKPTQVTFDALGAVDPEWTADGRELVFHSGSSSSNGSLKRVAADGSGPPRKMLGVGNPLGGFALSRKGGRIAFAQGNGDADIWRYDLTGAEEPRRWASTTRYENNAIYSPDGSRIALSSNRSGSREIWVTDAAGGNAQRLTDFGGPLAGTPRWSPDGKLISFDARPAGDSEIFVIGAEGTGMRQLTDHPGEDARPAWSPDGKWIYFASELSGRSEIWRMPSEGGRALQVTRTGGLSALVAADNWVYYRQGTVAGPRGFGPGWNEVEGLRKIRPDGSGDTLAVTANIDAMGFALTPSGLWFHNYGGRTATVELLLLDGTRKKVLDLPFRPDSGLSLTPDERYVLVGRPDEKGTDLMLVEGFR